MTHQLRIEVINLRRREDRRRAMAEQLDRLGLEARFVDAVDHRDLSPMQRMPQSPGLSDFDPLSAPELACALSHIALWESFVARQESYLCVLEDDQILRPHFPVVVRSAPQLMAGRQLVKLDRAPIGKARLLLSGPDHLLMDDQALRLARLHSRWLGSGAYVISREAALTLLKHTRQFRRPIDHMLFNPIHSPVFSGKGVHVLFPAPTWHSKDGSDIEGVRGDARYERGWRLRKFSREWGNALGRLVGLRARLGGARWVQLEGLDRPGFHR